jgi:hypothetical protein
MVEQAFSANEQVMDKQIQWHVVKEISNYIKNCGSTLDLKVKSFLWGKHYLVLLFIWIYMTISFLLRFHCLVRNDYWDDKNIRWKHTCAM